MSEFLSPEATLRLLKLAKSCYRPREIRQLKKEIEEKTRCAQSRLEATGEIDDTTIHEIVNMKLALDGLYGAWAEGELQ